MKKATIIIILLAAAFACQHAGKMPEPEKLQYYFVFSASQQKQSPRTCIYNLQPYTYIARDANQVADYRRHFSDAVVRDSAISTSADIIQSIICGTSQNGYYE